MTGVDRKGRVLLGKNKFLLLKRTSEEIRKYGPPANLKKKKGGY